MAASGCFGVNQVAWQAQAPSPVLYPAPPIASLPSPSGGQWWGRPLSPLPLRPLLMEPTGRCRDTATACRRGGGTASGLVREKQESWRKVGRRPRCWWRWGEAARPGAFIHTRVGPDFLPLGLRHFPVNRSGSGDRKQLWLVKNQWPLIYLVAK